MVKLSSTTLAYTDDNLAEHIKFDYSIHIFKEISKKKFILILLSKFNGYQIFISFLFHIKNRYSNPYLYPFFYCFNIN